MDPSIKRLLAGVYNRAAPIYGQQGVPFFAIFGRRLADLAQIAPGMRVLDAGMGRGAVLFPAAARIEERGLAVGIDIAERMLQESAAEVHRRDLRNAHVLQKVGAFQEKGEQIVSAPLGLDLLL